MKASTIALLKEAHDYCDKHDKSTEFMLEYMQDVAGVDLDTVLDYLENKNENNGKDKESSSEKGESKKR